MVGREKRKQGQEMGKNDRGTGSWLGVACPASPLEALWQSLTSALLSTFTRESCLLMSTKELLGFKASRQDGCWQFTALRQNGGKASVVFVIASSRTSG